MKRPHLDGFSFIGDLARPRGERSRDGAKEKSRGRLAQLPSGRLEFNECSRPRIERRAQSTVPQFSPDARQKRAVPPQLRRMRVPRIERRANLAVPHLSRYARKR